MKLQTQIPLNKQEHNLIDYNSKLLLFGSCFVENIGEKLNYFKFQNTVNPFGILFNPKAIEILIKNALDDKVYLEKDIFFNNEQWHCFDAHSQLSNSSKEQLLKNLNDSLGLINKQIKKSTHIVITLGTAWVYHLIETNKTVANCHKIPQKEFNKTLLSVKEIKNSLEIISESIQSVNTKASIIFTVSPIRHIKDGFIENAQSKAHLISAIHEFLNQQLLINNRQSLYFPSYEIMMDELRDYRFYNDDMIHPNKTAVNYIWERFKYVWISSKIEKTMNDVDAIQKGLLHKPFNALSKKHLEFLKKLEIQKEKISKQFPSINF